VAELDLNKLYNDMVDINDRITKLPVFPSLGWVWTFDILKDIFDNNHEDGMAEGDIIDEVVPTTVTLQQIFNKFYEDIDKLDLNMDQGGEMLEETIRDWMRDNDFLVALDEDGWLDD